MNNFLSKRCVVWKRVFRLALNRMSRLIEQLLLIDIEWLETSPTKLNWWKEVRVLLIYFRAVNWFDFDSNSWHWNKPDKASFKIMDRLVVALKNERQLPKTSSSITHDQYFISLDGFHLVYLPRNLYWLSQVEIPFKAYFLYCIDYTI